MKTTHHESAVDFLMSELQVSETKSDFLLAFWLYWVESVTVNSTEFQQVLANAPVNKWFLVELAKEEREFKLLAASYSELAGQGREIDLLYIKCVSKLMSRFPQALLQQAKKRETKPKAKKVTGIPVLTSILNQN